MNSKSEFITWLAGALFCLPFTLTTLYSRLQLQIELAVTEHPFAHTFGAKDRAAPRYWQGLLVWPCDIPEPERLQGHGWHVQAGAVPQPRGHRGRGAGDYLRQVGQR